ncbi:PAP2 superfamily protein [Flavobacteriaceae bacterium MAR_2010_188]|nr:PAP2 superfamily protein [Flavobacteriaceae bacterium MAR_2010_188]
MKISKNLRNASLLFILSIMFAGTTQAQSDSPYEWKWVRDGIWTGAGIVGSGYGLLLIQEKDDITEAELNQLNTEDINFLDRWVAGNSSEKANSISDIPFAFSFTAPFILLFDDEVNDHTGQVLGLYLESMATTGAMYAITAGLVNRSRPYVYDTENDLNRRLSNNGQRSFYSGHVAAAATATFFTAKVFSDFNPDAKGKAWIWAGAATVPAVVGYFRLQAGQHFLTDVLLGYGLGATVGILVPELHKIKSDRLSFYPTGGRNQLGIQYNALAMNYRF